ncbi:MAG: radical SAM protein [candidate division Zixibacteria bacterium]|nr:radical SAM protein [candidate division Zixibacteria bacterium]
MRILLVNPPAINFYHRIGLKLPPLGLAYLASILRQKKHQVRIVDLNVEALDYHSLPYEEFDLVGISVDTTRYPVSQKIAQAAKRRGVKVLMGGPHATFFDEEILSSSSADYVIRGEGEYGILDLADALGNGGEIGKIGGLSYRENGTWDKNPSRPFIQDLDFLPFPARDLLPLNLYTLNMGKRYSATMVTSRGCPFDCDFCSCSQFSGVKWRTRSVDNIIDEVSFLYNHYGYRAISFLDDNFTLNPNRVVDFCEKILHKGLDLEWWAFSRIDTIVKNEKMVQLMSKAGLRQVFIGFESGDQETLDGFGKNLEADTAFKGMEILRKNKIDAWGSFIIGCLDETSEMIKKTIRYAKRLNPAYAQFSVLTPYPGTRLYDSVKDRLLTDNWEIYWGGQPVIRLDKISPKELQRLIIRAYLSFYLRPKKFFQLTLPYLYKILWGYKKNKKIPLEKKGDDWVPTKEALIA